MLMYCHSCGSHQATYTNFCGVCGTRKRHSDVQSETNQEELIRSYFCIDLIIRLYVCSLKSFTVLQLAYERLKDDWLTIGSIKLEVIYQMPVCK